jgi:hypothetical protein
MTPQRGAEIWKSYIQPLKASHNLTLVSPVPASAPTGPVWLQEFIDACGPECTIDVIALRKLALNTPGLVVEALRRLLRNERDEPYSIHRTGLRAVPATDVSRNGAPLTPVDG